MKVIILITLLALTAGCTSRTSFGVCVGAFDDQNPKLEYKLSAWNLFWGIVGFEIIVPPIVVLVDNTFCPVGVKP